MPRLQSKARLESACTAFQQGAVVAQVVTMADAAKRAGDAFLDDDFEAAETLFTQVPVLMPAAPPACDVCLCSATLLHLFMASMSCAVCLLQLIVEVCVHSIKC